MDKIKTTLSVIAALMFLFAAAEGSAAPASAPSLVGFWYGIGEPGDPEVFYIDAFSADGKFNAEYRKCEKGKLIYQQTQSGTWKIADGVLTINSTEINGMPGKFDHSYDDRNAERDRVSRAPARSRLPVRGAPGSEIRIPRLLSRRVSPKHFCA